MEKGTAEGRQGSSEREETVSACEESPRRAFTARAAKQALVEVYVTGASVVVGERCWAPVFPVHVLGRSCWSLIAAMWAVSYDPWRAQDGT